jgi:hypothetical protein
VLWLEAQPISSVNRAIATTSAGREPAPDRGALIDKNFSLKSEQFKLAAMGPGRTSHAFAYLPCNRKWCPRRVGAARSIDGVVVALS